MFSKLKAQNLFPQQGEDCLQTSQVGWATTAQDKEMVCVIGPLRNKTNLNLAAEMIIIIIMIAYCYKCYM